MQTSLDLVISGGEALVYNLQNGKIQKERVEIGVKDGKIAEIATQIAAPAKAKMNAKGLTILPGAIDTQVHFRDPGFAEKEDLQSGSRAALFGGVTSFFDMPNTKPPTLSALDVADKISRAKNCWSNYAFYMGGAPSNVERLGELERVAGVCGVKIFMGSSTGQLIVGSDDNLEIAVKNISRRFAVHAEDEPRLQERKKIVTESPGQVGLHPEWRDVETAMIATRKIIGLARKYKKQVHVLHVTTADEAQFLADKKDCSSFEVTPQHLTLSAPECYERLGTLAQMNPPIRDEKHRQGLWAAVRSGAADVIGSDHAPHTLAEKKGVYPNTPSGMTGVQTLLPLMVHHSLNGELSLERVVEMTAQKPAELFKIKNKGRIQVGFDADFALVNLNANKKIENSWIQSRCGWTPFDGMTLRAWVTATVVNGHISYRDGEVIGTPKGQVLSFD